MGKLEKIHSHQPLKGLTGQTNYDLRVCILTDRAFNQYSPSPASPSDEILFGSIKGSFLFSEVASIALTDKNYLSIQLRDNKEPPQEFRVPPNSTLTLQDWRSAFDRAMSLPSSSALRHGSISGSYLPSLPSLLLVTCGERVLLHSDPSKEY